MTQKKFLVSVADVFGYDENDNLLFAGKTLLDTSIETALSNTDVRGGRGNQLLYVYYQGADMTFTISDAQWNLDFVAATVGEDVATGTNIYTEETVTLAGGGAGTVVGTPIAIQGTALYGWVTLESGVVEKVTFTGKNFTASGGTSGDVVCVRYFAANAAARSLTIPANIIPSIVRLVMEAQLNSSDASTNRIGIVQVIVPKCTLTGNFSIALTPDGVASTPLSGRALAYTPSTSTGCTAEPILAEIVEILDSANWWDSVIALAITGGDFSLVHPTTRQLSIRAIPSTGAAFTPPMADLTFASGTVGTATIDAAGLITTVGAGTSTIKVSITAAPTIDANLILTVTT